MTSELLQRLKQGEDQAYGEALRLHGPAVYGFLLRLTRSRELAEDLFQETWLALARNARTLDDATRLEPWLFTVARNLYRSHRRWRWVDVSRWLVAEPDETNASTAPSPEDDAATGETVRALETALATLRPGDRELLLLTSVDGLAPSDVAAILGTSQETLRQRLARARSSLSDAMLRIDHPVTTRKS